MRPEIRFHSIIVTVTVALMYLALTWAIPRTPVTSQNVIVFAILSAASSLGLYRVAAISFAWLLERWPKAMEWVLGPYYVRGTWTGDLKTKTGEERIVIEHYEQSLRGLAVSGWSFTLKGELDATWTARTVQIDAEDGIMYCFYNVNVTKKIQQVEGIGVLQFDRPSNRSAPRAMSGYGLDTDAAFEAASGESAGLPGKLGFEYSKRSSLLEEVKKVKEELLQDRRNRDSPTSIPAT